MNKLFAFLLIVFVSSCSATKPLELNKLIAKEEKECNSTNGKLQRVGNFIYACAWPATDPGKTCNDSTECDGICELPESAHEISSSNTTLSDGTVSQPIIILRVKVGDNLQGVCSPLKFAGKDTNCKLLIQQGKVTLTKCVE